MIYIENATQGFRESSTTGSVRIPSSHLTCLRVKVVVRPQLDGQGLTAVASLGQSGLHCVALSPSFPKKVAQDVDEGALHENVGSLVVAGVWTKQFKRRHPRFMHSTRLFIAVLLAQMHDMHSRRSHYYILIHTIHSI